MLDKIGIRLIDIGVSTSFQDIQSICIKEWGSNRGERGGNVW